MKLYQTYLSVRSFCFQVVKARNGELKNWDELGCLKSNVAFIILIEQFCRNIYRVRIGIHFCTLHLLENGVNHFFSLQLSGKRETVSLCCSYYILFNASSSVVFVWPCYWWVWPKIWLLWKYYFIPRGQQMPSVMTQKL